MARRHMRRKGWSREGELEGRFADAIERHRAGQLDEAAEVYAEVLEQVPDHAPALSMTGVLALQRGQPQQAVHPLVRATLLDPEQPGYFLNLGNALRGSDRLAEAEQAYRRALDLSPEMAPAHNNLGNVLRDERALHDAVRAYRRALELRPSFFAAAANLAQTLAELDDAPREDVLVAYEHALALADRAGQRDTDVANAHNARGNLLLAAGRGPEAIECYREAIAIDPRFYEAHLNLAHAHARALQLAEAVEPFRAAIALQPYEPTAYKRLALVLRRLQRNDEAHEVYRAWHQHDPDDPIAAHMAHAGGTEPPERASADFIAREFDDFADNFETVLLDELDYQGPRLVAGALRRTGVAERRELAVLDAGCGTGLCAGFLRPLADRLVGLDLSAKMLAKARTRGSYDELVVAELTAFVRAHSRAFDLVVAADVVPYLGRLDELAAAVRGALRPGGTVVLTAEAGSDPERGWTLGEGGRYSHHSDYLRHVLTENGLRLEELVSERLRMELGAPAMGWVITASLPA